MCQGKDICQCYHTHLTQGQEGLKYQTMIAPSVNQFTQIKMDMTFQESPPWIVLLADCNSRTCESGCVVQVINDIVCWSTAITWCLDQWLQAVKLLPANYLHII